MKIARKAALVLTLIASFAAPTMAASVKYDFDPTVDFSGRRRLAWRAPRTASLSLAEARVERALEDGFRARGYPLLEAAKDADFLVEYHVAARGDVKVSERWGRGFGRDLRVDRVPVGVLIVDVYSRDTGRLVWRGMVSDALESSPEKADRKVARAVARLLEKFPPNQKR